MNARARTKGWRAAAGLLLAAVAALAGLTLPGGPILGRLLEPLELTTRDWRARIAAEPSARSGPVTLVLLDSASIADWPYQVPFPRTVLANLVDSLSAAGARTIALDVLLDRRQPELEPLGHGDARLREAIRRAGNVVLAAMTVETDSGRMLVAPHPYFAEMAAAVGTADVPVLHETVREIALTVATRDSVVPGFSLAAYAGARGLAVDSMMRAARARGALELPGFAPAPMPEPGGVQPLPILFSGPPSRADRDDGAFRAIAASTALALGSLLPAELIRDRVVLVGSGLAGQDEFRSPFFQHAYDDGEIAGFTPGVEVHATAVQTLLRARYPREPGRGATLLLLFGLSLLVTAVTLRRGAVWGAACAALLLLAHAAAATALFASAQIHLPIVASGVALGLSLMGATGFVALAEGRDKRLIRHAFSRYLAPAVVNQLLDDPSRLVLGGERREVTILFTDLVGFTSLAERLDPETLVGLLNRYLDEMTRLVLAEGGTLDKYIGDAVMAFYGAPTAQPDHATRACRTALRMQQRLREVNREWASEGLPELGIRIGINTGVPVVGNIGGREHFDYTVLGDAVNLAARLEPACKEYGVGILISEYTRVAAGEEILARELGFAVLRGRTEPVRVFELTGLPRAAEAGELPHPRATTECIGSGSEAPEPALPAARLSAAQEILA